MQTSLGSQQEPGHGHPSPVKWGSPSSYCPSLAQKPESSCKITQTRTRGVLVVHTTCVVLQPQRSSGGWSPFTVSGTRPEVQPNTMQEIPLQGYSASSPGQLGPRPPQSIRPLSAPSPPSASPPATARLRGSRCATGGGSDRTASPAPGVG